MSLNSSISLIVAPSTFVLFSACKFFPTSIILLKDQNTLHNNIEVGLIDRLNKSSNYNKENFIKAILYGADRLSEDEMNYFTNKSISFTDSSLIQNRLCDIMSEEGVYFDQGSL